MNCPKCGDEIYSDSQSCQKCGVTLSDKGAGQGRGPLILTLGIISIVLIAFSLGPVFGIPAWSFGNSDMKKIKEGAISRDAKGMTQTGVILGMISSIIGVILWLGILISLLVVFFGR